MTEPVAGVDRPPLAGGEFQDATGARRGRLVRRAVVVVLSGFVVAGLLGAFGYRQRDITVVSGDYVVTLSHPAVTRGGLPARWSVRIGTRGHEPMPRVEIRTTAAYFDIFDHNDLTPEPDETWQTDDVTWTYVPDGDRSLRVSLDVRTQPDARWRHRATTRVVVDGRVVADFDYQTFVVP